MQARPDTGAGSGLLESLSAADGGPLAGALVQVWEPQERTTLHHFVYRSPVLRGETDAGGGHVAVPAQETAALELTMRLAYFLPYGGPYVPGQRVVLARVPLAHWRILTAARQPVAGATVTAVNLGDLHTVSRADGTFSLRLPSVDRVLAEKDSAVALSPAFDLEVKKREAETAQREGAKQDISFGSQIRSYVLAPYRMVKDLRTGIE